MDQLTKDAIEARRLGLSYGKYKGLQYEAQQKAKAAAAAEKERKPKPGQRWCKVCQKEIPLTVSSSRYCSPECAAKAQAEMQQARDHRKYLRRKGIELPPEPEVTCGMCNRVVKNKRRKYCCPECAERAKQLQTEASRLRARLRAGKK